MKIKINNTEIITALKFAIGLNQTNYANSGFNYVLINAINNQVRIEWANETISGIYVIKDGVEVIKEGKVLVKGKIILNLISKLRETKITFELIDNVLKMTADNYTSNINTVDLNLYKEIDYNTKGWDKIEIPTDIFGQGIRKVQSSALLHSEKINKFNGIYIDAKSKEKQLRFIATDSYKLSLKTFKFDQNAPIDFLIKATTVLQIINYLKVNEKINIFKHNTKLIFKTSNFTLHCPTIDADFPNIDNLIDTEHQFYFRVSLKEMLGALDRIIYLTNNDKNHAAEITVKDKLIKLECMNTDLGSSCETLTAIESNAKDLKISFNALYLVDLLKNFDHEVISFLFMDRDSAFHIIDEQEENFVQILVPILNF